MLLIYVLLFVAACGLRSGDIRSNDVSHVVVIPDVHGDADAAVRSLWLAHREIDGADAAMDFGAFYYLFQQFVPSSVYTGTPISAHRNVAVVQLGDITDRGPYGLVCLVIFDAIPKILGWNITMLYGNHELMNVMGTSGRFLHPKDADMYGGAAERTVSWSPGGATIGRITASFLGIAKLSSNAPIAGSRNPNTLFVHAGIEMDEWYYPTFESDPIDEVNSAIAGLVASFEWPYLQLLNENESILMTRILAYGDDELVCGHLIDQILGHFDVARVMVGHTPQEDKLVKLRCDGKIVLTDVMMSRWMETREVDETAFEGGRPVAVIMTIGSDGGLDSIAAHTTDLKTGTENETYVLAQGRPEGESGVQTAGIGGAGTGQLVVPPESAEEVQRTDMDVPAVTAGRSTMVLHSPSRPFGPSPSRSVKPVLSRHRLPGLLIGSPRAVPQQWRSSTSTDLIRPVAIVHRNDRVVVLRAREGPVNGLFTVFLTGSPFILSVAARSTPLGSLSVPAVRGVMPSGIPDIDPQGHYSLAFSATNTVSTLAAHFKTSARMVTKSVKDQTALIMHSIHERGLVVGLTVVDDVWEFFGVNEAGSEVSLIDWSRVDRASPGITPLHEQRLVRRAFAHVCFAPHGASCK